MIDTEKLIDEIMVKLVRVAHCERCICKKCNKGAVSINCFKNHPGWVSIDPGNLKRILREILKKEIES